MPIWAGPQLMSAMSHFQFCQYFIWPSEGWPGQVPLVIQIQAQLYEPTAFQRTIVSANNVRLAAAEDAGVWGIYFGLD